MRLLLSVSKPNPAPLEVVTFTITAQNIKKEKNDKSICCWCSAAFRQSNR